MYSSPPIHGARIVSLVLNDSVLLKEWKQEVSQIANRIISMRNALKESLMRIGSHDTHWEHITNQIGMFCYTGMTPDQVDRITTEFNIHMTRDGRISIAGINSGNVEYIANAIYQVTKVK